MSKRTSAVWEISGRQVALASEMTHQATVFLFLPRKSTARDCAREKGAGSGSLALRVCVWLSENNVSR